MSRIFSIDLGTWSVKVAIAHAGLRHAAISELIERPVPPGDEPHELRAGRVLAAIIREQHLERDTGYLVVGGAQLFVHVLEFAFKTTRRQDLDKIVGGELEGVVPVDLEDLVYAAEALPALAEPGPDAAVRGRVAGPTTGMRVLTYSMRLQRARELLALTAAAGNEARGLVPVAVLSRLAERAPSLAGPGAVAIVDVGHDHTHVVLAQGGRPLYSRSIGRGGRGVTEAIARVWKLPFAEAEQAKHTDGFIGSATNPAPSEAWARVHEVLVGEVGPWARELRQTLAACRAKTGVAASRVVLVGGGSRLRGLPAYVAGELGVPTSHLAETDAVALVGVKLGAATAIDAGALAIAAAHDLGGGRPSLDLRQGELAFKVDMSFVKTKLTQVAAAMLVVLAFAGASAWTGLRKLRQAEKTLNERVAVESLAVHNEVRTVDQILKDSKSAVVAGDSPMPDMSAYDLLLQINEKLPPRDKVTLDVSELEIKDDKVILKASAKTPAEVDLIEAALKQITCFKEVTRGSMQAVADVMNFSFTIRSECM